MTATKENLKQAFLKIKLPEASWWGLRYVNEVTTERMVRDKHPQSNDTFQTSGVMIEVLYHGHFSYAATPLLTENGLQQAANKALLQAKAACESKVFNFTSQVRPPSKVNFASANALHKRSPKEINELLVEISARLKKSEKIIRTAAYVRTVEAHFIQLSNEGMENEQNFSLITADFEATASHNHVFQKRTDGGLRGRSYQGGWEHLWSKDLWQRVDKVAEQALALVAAPDCPTGVLDLMIMPDQMMLQIHESIGHPLELDRILGDERNYAGWSFVKPEDFGHLQYGSSKMNVTFDPTIPQEFASYGVDDSGFEAKKEFLIQEGKLLRGLGGLESQLRSGLLGVANARSCSWNRAPIDRMANLNLEAGSSSFNEMVASVEDGVLMESNRSWSIDDFRNKFQFGCEYARRIRNGKLGEVVKNPNYRGVTVPFWNSLEKVGNLETLGVYGTPYCGKGEPNQIIRVGHASPVCLFKNIEVFGGV